MIYDRYQAQNYPQMGYQNSASGMGPYQPYTAFNQTMQGFNGVWVQGIEGAKGYPINPNQELMLMDSENPVLYSKKADAQGRIIEFKTYDLVERIEEPKKNIDFNEYVKHSDLKSLVDSMINEKLEALTSPGKGGSINA